VKSLLNETLFQIKVSLTREIQECISRVLSLDDRILLCGGLYLLTPQLAADTMKLWTHPAVKITLESRGSTFAMDPRTEYFPRHLERILSEDFIPLPEDIIQATSSSKSKTVQEYNMFASPYRFTLVDVMIREEKKNQLRKWVHHFENVSALIFCASLCEYNTIYAEGRSFNPLKESLELFRSLMNCSFFQKTPVILFLTDLDGFQKKFSKVPLRDSFPDYKGGSNWSSGSKFISKKFVSLATNQRKLFGHEIWSHTDTVAWSVLVDAAHEIIVTQNLARLGISL